MEDNSQPVGDDLEDGNNLEDERVTLLLNQLKNNKRTPKTFADSWTETAQHARGSSIARIFLDEGGLGAWLTYFLTKNAADVRYHFPGKADCSRLIATLEHDTVASRELAACVASKIDRELQEKINGYDKRIKQLENDSMSPHQTKRQRTTDGGSLLPASPNVHDTAATPSSVSRHLSVNHPAPAEQVTTYSSLDSTDYIAEDTNYMAEDKHVLIDASLAGATRLFPRALSNSIRRVPHSRNKNILVAAISTIFPSEPEVTDKFGCQMALEITADKVTHLARELFGAHLETKAGLRYIILSSGSKILPNPKFTLQGCPFAIMPSVFGVDASKAMATSPKYQEDNNEWRDTTDCVSMEISLRADEGAVIYVSMGLWEGTRIREKLYD